MTNEGSIYFLTTTDVICYIFLSFCLIKLWGWIRQQYRRDAFAEAVESSYKKKETEISNIGIFSGDYVDRFGNKLPLEYKNMNVSVHSYGGHATDVLAFPETIATRLSQEKRSSVDVLMIMIPGNPGLCDVYESFLRTMYRKHCQSSSKQLAIVCPSFVGHTFRSHHTGRLYTLKEQISHKAAFIESMIQTVYPEAKKVVLMGHSIGCYMIQRALASKPHFPSITNLVYGFPTISHIGSSPNAGKFHMKLMTSSIGRDFLVRPLLWLFENTLPRSYRTLLMEKTHGLSLPFRPHGWKLICSKMIRNSLYLAADEFSSLSSVCDLDTTYKLYPTTFLFTPTDEWCPPSFASDIKKKVSSTSTSHSFESFPSCKHAFVLYAEQIDLISSYLMDRIFS